MITPRRLETHADAVYIAQVYIIPCACPQRRIALYTASIAFMIKPQEVAKRRACANATTLSKSTYGLVEGAGRGNMPFCKPSILHTQSVQLSQLVVVARTRPLRPPLQDMAKSSKRFSRDIMRPVSVPCAAFLGRSLKEALHVLVRSHIGANRLLAIYGKPNILRPVPFCTLCFGPSTLSTISLTGRWCRWLLPVVMKQRRLRSI
jgi:hypothetical protein